MEEEHSKKKLSGFERFLYLALIPLVFTAVLAGTGVFLMNQGKGGSMADTIVKAGKSAVSLAQRATGGKQKEAAADAAASPQPAAGESTPQAGSGAGGPQTGTASTASPAPSPSASGAGVSSEAPATPSGTQSVSPAPSASADPTASVSGADFKKKADETAGQFSKMAASKAAPIIGSMTIKNAVFSMIGMKAQQRADILAKMDPKQAAAVAKGLVNFPPGAASDSGMLQNQFEGMPDDKKQPVEELAKTYSQMPAQNAAVLITELMKTDQKKAVSLMGQMEAGTRAQILSAMSSNKKDPDSIKFATVISQMLLNS